MSVHQPLQSNCRRTRQPIRTSSSCLGTFSGENRLDFNPAKQGQSIPIEQGRSFPELGELRRPPWMVLDSFSVSHPIDPLSCPVSPSLKNRGCSRNLIVRRSVEPGPLA
ncbi:unnamed protein product [Linum trigynum]|uniref:Uncharacterized protein n=1 Tax=Linum trigynum TaxID=586398 RepID=A0AAV2F7M2_9ROSI